MEARVKSEHRWRNVIAFGGIEFIKAEYRLVPAGFEKEAQAHPFLEVKGSVEEPGEELVEVEEEAEGAAKMTDEERKAKRAAKAREVRAAKKAAELKEE